MIRFYYVIVGSIIVYVVNATIEWEIEYGFDQKPMALKCRGPKTGGSWFRRWNRTDTTISKFDEKAQVTTLDPSFTTIAYVRKSEIQTQLGLPTGTFGTFGCKFGKDYHLFFLPKDITTYFDLKRNSVTLKCLDNTLKIIRSGFMT